MFDVHKFPVFVQTLTPGQVLEVHHIAPIPSLLPHFDLTKPADCALIVLLLRVKAHLEGQSPVVPACLFVDEGLRKDGRAIRIPSWSSAFAEGMICFSRSDVAFPLQLADFAAYSLNRSQILLAKQHLSDLDLEFLRIVQPLAVCFQNIPVGFADLQSVRNRQGN